MGYYNYCCNNYDNDFVNKYEQSNLGGQSKDTKQWGLKKHKFNTMKGATRAPLPTDPQELRLLAVITIQSAIRGYLTRKRLLKDGFYNGVRPSYL